MRILVADPDPGRTKSVAEALMALGHKLDRTPHGAEALVQALDTMPDVVVCPVDLPVIDGARLAEILRGNPRTRHVSMVFLARDELDAPISMDPRDATLVEPLSVEELRASVEAVAERGGGRGDARPSEIEGKLQQISLADLLQIFQMNRKSGTLRLFGQGAAGAGSLYIHAGQVRGARIPLIDGASIRGEKALYRMLTWDEGRFEFTPGEVEIQSGIDRPTRALLLEGTRQLDEWRRLVSQFPSPDLRLRRKAPAEAWPPDLPAAARDVVDAVEAYRELGPVVDHCPLPDYQALRAIADLLARGVLVTDAEAEGTAGEDRVFAPGQIRALRDWASAQHPRPGRVLKLAVLSAGPEASSRLLAALRDCGDFQAEARVLREPSRLARPHVLGHFSLGPEASLRLVSLPARGCYAPLHDVAVYGALGTLLVADTLDSGTLEELTGVARRVDAIDRRTPLLLCPEEVFGEQNPEVEPAEKEACERLAVGEVFRLPAAPRERVGVLRDLFARIVA